MLGTVWHIWIGVLLTAVVLGAAIGLIAYYMMSVQAKKYPGGKQRRHQDL
ncbi:hypothetical protein [Ilumatobacter nonamiensis]|nr:hypothetical protein [Ilumatobacter nonamiensis]